MTKKSKMEPKPNKKNSRLWPLFTFPWANLFCTFFACTLNSVPGGFSLSCLEVSYLEVELAQASFSLARVGRHEQEQESG